MVECISAFMECCYIARRNAITSFDLKAFETHLTRFQDLRKIFIETGVRTSISLPRQHALFHYISKVELFGSPNGTCSSITESRHIKAVKEPWRCSSRFDALPQMTKTIQRVDKLTALRRIFDNRRMLDGKLSHYISAAINGHEPAILPYSLHPSEETNDVNTSDDDDEGGPLSTPTALAQVVLAAKRG